MRRGDIDVLTKILKRLQDKSRSNEEKIKQVDDVSRFFSLRNDTNLLSNLSIEPHRKMSVMNMIFQVIVQCIDLKFDRCIVKTGILLCSEFDSCRDRVSASLYNLGIRLLRDKQFEDAREQFQHIIQIQDMKKIKNEILVVRSLIGTAESHLLLGSGSQALTCLEMTKDFECTKTDSNIHNATRILKSRIFLFQSSRVLKDLDAKNEDLERALRGCEFDDIIDDNEFKKTSHLVRAKIFVRLNRNKEAHRAALLALKSSPKDPNVIQTVICVSPSEDQDSLSLLHKLRNDELRLLLVATHAKASNRLILLSETLRLIARSSCNIETRIKALCELATSLSSSTTKTNSNNTRRWSELLDTTLDVVAHGNDEDDVTTNAMRYILRLTIDHYLSSNNKDKELSLKIPTVAYEIATRLEKLSVSPVEMRRVRFRLLYVACRSLTLNDFFSSSNALENSKDSERDLGKGKRLHEDTDLSSLSCVEMHLTRLKTLRQLAIEIANFKTEGIIITSSEYAAVLSQIDLWTFRALAVAKKWKEMRITVQTAIGNLDDDHARAFLCDVIETCDKSCFASELVAFSRDVLEMLLKLEHRQVQPNINAIANVEREICNRSVDPVQAFAQAFDTASNLGPFSDTSCSWFALRSYNCGVDYALRRKLDHSERLIKTSLRFLEMCRDDFKSRYLDQINSAYGEVLSLIQKQGDIVKNRWN